jgi:hypothetical protein
MPALDTNRCSMEATQLGVVEVYFQLAGAATDPPTFASSADNDNRFITSAGDGGVGVYTFVLNKHGRVFQGATATFESAANFYHLWSCSFSGSTLTVKLKDAAGAAIDLASGDTLRLAVRFKNCGA